MGLPSPSAPSAGRLCLLRLAAIQLAIGLLVCATYALRDRLPFVLPAELVGGLVGAAVATAAAGLVLVRPLAQRGKASGALSYLVQAHKPDPTDQTPLAEGDLRAAAAMLGVDRLALLVREPGRRTNTAWGELHVLQRGRYLQHRVPLSAADAMGDGPGFPVPPGVHLSGSPLVKRLVGQAGELGRIVVDGVGGPAGEHGTPETLLALLAAWWSMRLDNRRLAADAQARLLDIVESLITSVEAKDPYTSGHSKRVCKYAELVAQAMGVAGRELEEIAIGAALHDVGKLGIPEHVLRKPAKLDDEEWQQMRSHPKVGARIIDSFNQSYAVLHAIHHHHEHFDGRGYPSGLAGEAIPLSARIVGVADALDAMTSQRAYQRNRTVADALEEIRRSAGRQFDPAVVDAITRVPLAQLEAIAPKPSGQPAAPALAPAPAAADAAGAPALRLPVPVPVGAPVPAAG
jgi:putative nucleotidyltransferase with HDIG domain